MMPKNNPVSRGGHFFTNLLLIFSGIAFYLALSHFDQLRHYLRTVLNVFNPFLVGIVIAYLLNAPTCFFERKLFHQFRFRRGLSILSSYLLACAVVGVLLLLVLPQLVHSVVSLAENFSSYLDNFNLWVLSLIDRFELNDYLVEHDMEQLGGVLLTYQDVLEKFIALVSAQIPRVLDYGVAIGNGLVSGLTALISSVYMLAGKERLLSQIRRTIFALLPLEQAKWVLSVCATANRAFSVFIYGKLLDSAIIGLICFPLCTIFRIPLALLISVVVGVTNVIPFFGPFIGAIPCSAILLIMDPLAALRFMVLILALQQFDGNILGPRILGNSTGLSPIWVLISIVVGGGLFGFPGMLLGVPTFAVIYTLTRDWVNRRLWEKDIRVTEAGTLKEEENT